MPLRFKFPQLSRKLFLLCGLAIALLVAMFLLPYGLLVRSAPPHADALVILSGSATYLERADHAARLWHAGRAPRIILTYDGQSAGWDVRRQRNPSFSERSADELQRLGVPLTAIDTIPDLVTTTHDEAARVRLYAEAKGLQSLIFVTTPYHTRRARWTVERVFAGSRVATGIEAPPPGQQSPAPLTWWASVTGWKLVPGEYVKFFYYWLRY